MMILSVLIFHIVLGQGGYDQNDGRNAAYFALQGLSLAKLWPNSAFWQEKDKGHLPCPGSGLTHTLYDRNRCQLCGVTFFNRNAA